MKEHLSLIGDGGGPVPLIQSHTLDDKRQSRGSKMGKELLSLFLIGAEPTRACERNDKTNHLFFPFIAYFFLPRHHHPGEFFPFPPLSRWVFARLTV